MKKMGNPLRKRVRRSREGLRHWEGLRGLKRRKGKMTSGLLLRVDGDVDLD
jgi:hypothetical protein